MAVMGRPASAPESAENGFASGGEMARLFGSHDWSGSALGPISGWPQSLRTAVDICLNSHFAILVWWGRDLCMLYNDAYRRIIAGKHPFAFGRPGREVWPEIWNTIEPMLAQAMQEGRATRAEDLLLLLRRRGYPEECYFTFSYSPIRDESGKFGGVFTPVLETTARVVHERRLRTLREMAEAGPPDSDCAEVLRTVAPALARNPYDLPFVFLYEASSGGSEARLRAGNIPQAGETFAPPVLALDAGAGGYLAPAFARAVRFACAVEIMLPDGHDLPRGAWETPPVAALLVPVPRAGGTQPAAFLLCGLNPYCPLNEGYRGFLDLLGREISGRVVAAEGYAAERRRAESLAALDHAKTAFFTNISHEFRTPLALILEPLAQLSGGALDAAQREKVAMAQRATRRLLRLVNTLLSFSRIEAGRMRARFVPTDLAAVTMDVASVFRSGVEAAGLRFTVGCEPLPQPVYVDSELWEQVVLNLLSNAFKYTLRGEIAVELRGCDAGVELLVRDTGTGIPASEQPRIFERFHRIENPGGRSIEGSGIGLSLVRELVLLHGGEISFESREGEGSTFCVRLRYGSRHLPAEQIAAAPPVPPTTGLREAFLDESRLWLPAVEAGETGAPQPATESREQASVFFADDNADMRDAVARALAPYYRVRFAANGRDALEALRRDPPDLLLADVMMPEIDGFGLLAAVRGDARLRALPVILVSARAGEEARNAGLAARADDYVVKPFRMRDLVVRIEQQLALAALRREAAAREQVLQAQEEHLRAAERLREREAVLNAIFEHAPGGIALLDARPDGRFLRVNAAMCGILGYSEAELVERTIRQVTHEADWPENARMRNDLLAGRIDRFSLLKRMRRKDGDVVWALSTIAAVRGDAGRLRYTVKQLENVTARVEAEARLRAFMEHNPSPMFIKDRAGRYVHANRSLCASFGLLPDAILGHTDAEIFPAPQARAFAANDALVLESGVAHTFEERAFHVDGEHVSMVAKFAIRDAADEIVALGGVVTDITERIRADETLRRSAGEMALLHRRFIELQETERRRIAAELHDRVGQTLTAIGINLEAIGSSVRGASGSRVRDSIGLVAATTAAIRETIAELRPPLLEELGLAAALRRFTRDFRLRTGVAVDVRRAGSRFASRSLVRDIAMFRIAQEALNNVAKHAHARRVAIVVHDRPGQFGLDISDDGRGIDARADGSGGDALGMRTMRERAAAVGASLRIESAPGLGTTIKVMSVIRPGRDAIRPRRARGRRP